MNSTVARTDGGIVVQRPKTSQSRRAVPTSSTVVDALHQTQERQWVEEEELGIVNMMAIGCSPPLAGTLSLGVDPSVR